MSTSPASLFDDRMPSSEEIDNANALRQMLAGQIKSNEPTEVDVVLKNKSTGRLVLMPALTEILMEVLRHIGSGRAVTIVPIGVHLSTQQAADLLNVSRPYLIKLLEQGEIKYSTVGRHRRLKAEDVLAYKRRMDADRESALSDLAATDAKLNLI